ncbi:MAG: KDGP aldolase [Angelakisella sp.]
MDLGNFEEIVRIAVQAGVQRIIPHVYSSIVDSTGATRIADVQALYGIIRSLV